MSAVTHEAHSADHRGSRLKILGDDLRLACSAPERLHRHPPRRARFADLEDRFLRVLVAGSTNAMRRLQAAHAFLYGISEGADGKLGKLIEDLPPHSLALSETYHRFRDILGRLHAAHDSADRRDIHLLPPDENEIADRDSTAAVSQGRCSS